jgi:hypothetical protein
VAKVDKLKRVKGYIKLINGSGIKFFFEISDASKAPKNIGSVLKCRLGGGIFGSDDSTVAV